MSPEQKRKFNTVFGSVFITTGIFAWALTAYFAVTPNPKRPAPVVHGLAIDLPSCQKTLTSLGYEATIKNKEVTAHEMLSATDPKQQLDRATIAATVCRLPMKSFCMGEGCERPGVTLVVTADETAVRPSAAPSKPATAASGAAAKPAGSGGKP
jgi:hypothetical protein